MKYLLSLLLVTLTLLYPLINFGQENYTIEWGQANIPRGDLVNIIGVDGNDFHTLSRKALRSRLIMGGANDFTISRIQDYKNSEPIKLRLKGDSKPTDLEGIMDFRHSILALSSSTSFSSKTNKLYYHLFPKNAMVGENEGIKIAEYAFRDGGNSRDIFQYDFSQDTSKLGIVYEIKGDRNAAVQFGYVVLDDSMRTINSGNHILNYNTFQLDIVNHYTNNNGEFFIIAKEYRKRNNSGSWDKFNRVFNQVKVFKVDKTGAKDLQINKDGRRIVELKMIRDSIGNFICSGFYSTNQNNNVTGAFAINLNSKTNEFSNWNTSVFNSTITNAMRIDSRFYVTNSELYELKELIATNDGGFIGTSEINYTEEIQRNGPNGTIQSEYHFNSNSILNFKIDKSGKIAWTNLIPKIQYSINDAGLYLSHARYVQEDKVYFLFNDDDDNYNDNFQFDFPTNIESMNANNRRNVMAVVEVDLSSGKKTRYSIGDRKSFGTTLVPTVYQVDQKNGSLIIYGKTTKEQFGRIAFR